jgi:hypothetical protein
VTHSLCPCVFVYRVRNFLHVFTSTSYTAWSVPVAIGRGKTRVSPLSVYCISFFRVVKTNVRSTARETKKQNSLRNDVHPANASVREAVSAAVMETSPPTYALAPSASTSAHTSGRSLSLVTVPCWLTGDSNQFAARTDAGRDAAKELAVGAADSPRRSAPLEASQGRSIQSDGGVELKGVRWS